MQRFEPAQDVPLEALGGFMPMKCVKTNTDIEFWQRSEAYYSLVGFINGISTAIQGIRISDPNIYESDTLKKLLILFDKLNELVDTTPPIDQPQRFGNKAFRTWSRKMNHDIFLMLKDALPQEKCELFSELGFYLAESFGNSIRIDYGTGHELSFIFFLCGLFKAEIFTENDSVAAVLKLFNAYLIFVRRLQTTYRMEPAGSQGVWSLDDYQFIPFIWGSAQLAYKTPFEPSKFLDEPIINDYKDDYMFISCIDYISKVKTGHFAEHSNQLWSISAVPTWSKINSGLVKMYQKEILSKFPIIQHVLFGKLMPFKSVQPGTNLTQARLGFVREPIRVSKLLVPPPHPEESVSEENVASDVSSNANKKSTDETQKEEQKDERKEDLSEYSSEKVL